VDVEVDEETDEFDEWEGLRSGRGGTVLVEQGHGGYGGMGGCCGVVEREPVVIGVAGGAVSGGPVVMVEIVVGNHGRICSTGIDLFWKELWPATI
jgi:hypothetical protein